MLLARGLPQVEVLKVAHHGSRHVVDRRLPRAVRPSIAVASAGLGNPYGHPAPADPRTTAPTRCDGLRTDLNGTVDITLEPTGWIARAEPPRPTTGRSHHARTSVLPATTADPVQVRRSCSRCPRRPRGRATGGTAANADLGYDRPMSVPDRVEAARLSWPWIPRPGTSATRAAVAEIAGWLAARIVARGIPIDRRLVEAAGLLHDVDKALPATISRPGSPTAIAAPSG